MFCTAIVDPETSIEFPSVLKLDKTPGLSLLGLGVRRVTIFKVAIYSIGFYADLGKLDLTKV